MRQVPATIWFVLSEMARQDLRHMWFSVWPNGIAYSSMRMTQELLDFDGDCILYVAGPNG